MVSLPLSCTMSKRKMFCMSFLSLSWYYTFILHYFCVDITRKGPKLKMCLNLVIRHKLSTWWEKLCAASYNCSMFYNSNNKFKQYCSGTQNHCVQNYNQINMIPEPRTIVFFFSHFYKTFYFNIFQSIIVTCDMQHMTRGTWQVTCYMQEGTHKGWWKYCVKISDP